jgi:N-acetylmuramoyl-L-alanine amidase
LFNPQIVFANNEDKPLEGIIIFIDPGHRGDWNYGYDKRNGKLVAKWVNGKWVPLINKEEFEKIKKFVEHGDGGSTYPPGAPWNKVKIEEADVTLTIAKRLKKLLEGEGATVYMSRDKDVYIGLKYRAEMANKKNADYFISIHLNSSTDMTKNYTQGLYYPKSTIGKELATILQEYLHDALGIPQGDPTAKNLPVLRETNMPAVLMECAFISNTTEANLLMKSNARAYLMAQAIIDGIIAYLVPIVVSIDPLLQNFMKSGESHTHIITIKNNTKDLKTANITVKLIKKSKCLSITKYPVESMDFTC